MSFADGFRSGFGLVSNVQDRELKRDQLEADSLYKTQQADDLRAYREEDLEIKRAAQKSKAGIDALTAGTARINAETASTKANTAQTIADNKTNPESIEYKTGLSEIAENKAQENKYNAEADETRLKLDKINAADRVQQISNLIQADDKTPEMYGKIASLVEQNAGSSHFNLGYITSPQTKRSMATIQTYFQDMQAGTATSMGKDVRSAVGGALGLNQSAAIGREIDDSFVNAPDWMKGKGLRISGQGLHEVSSPDGKTFNGKLYVLTEDESGKVNPYFPPLTANRNFRDGESLNLDIDPAVQGLAGIAHMVGKIAPEIEKDVRDAMIYQKFGSKKAFEDSVDNELRGIAASLKSGGNPSAEMLILNENLASMTPLKREEFALSKEYRRVIEHEKLFDATDDRSEQFMIEEWFENTSAALSSAPVPKGIDAENLGALMARSNASFNYENVSVLNGYYNEKGEIEDANGLIEQLKKFNLLK